MADDTGQSLTGRGRTPRLTRVLAGSAMVAVVAAAGCSFDSAGHAVAGDDDTGAAGLDSQLDDSQDSDRPNSDARPTPDDTAVTDGFAGSDTPTGSDTRADSDAAADTGPDEPPVTRFIVIGDTGEGNDPQYRIAAGAQARCDRAGGCAGFLMLGDDIYDSGPDSADDPQFTEKIDKPYRVLKRGAPPADGQPDTRERMPIYVSLGNHDLGGLGVNRDLIDHYLDYADTHDWFHLPSAWWSQKVGNVELMALETNSLATLGSKVDQQAQMVTSATNSTDARWTVAFGHHPYRSDGRHGNAGSYEGIPGDLTPLGGDFRAFVDDVICNKVDFYLSGHDHNRQWFNSVPNIPTWPIGADNRRPCNTWFGVSGAGSKTREMEDRDNDLAFGEATLGFMFLEFHANQVIVEMCDPDGQTEWTRTLTGH